MITAYEINKAVQDSSFFSESKRKMAELALLAKRTIDRRNYAFWINARLTKRGYLLLDSYKGKGRPKNSDYEPYND